MTRVIGRFAPSPSGPLHAGSLVAALASWLDVRAAGGQWLVRIEDIDPPREVTGAARLILDQLERCGLVADAPPLYQSSRGAHYQSALDRLLAAGWAYPCGCSRRDVAAALAATAGHGDGAGQAGSGGELVYANTCRDGLQAKPARSFRLRVAHSPAKAPGEARDPPRPAGAARDHVPVDWHDRRLGAQVQDVAGAAGDFVLKRADGLWAYQLAVVVDDAAQGITDVVRGEDLVDNTARQIYLQRRLGLPTPRYLHVPLVRNPDGSKLSKQTGAPALDLADPLATLRAAGAVLGIEADAASVADWLGAATREWHARWPRA